MGNMPEVILNNGELTSTEKVDYVRINGQNKRYKKKQSPMKRLLKCAR